MEKRLRLSFDRLRFEDNDALRAVIDSIHARYPDRRLSDDDVDAVTAAKGLPESALKRETPWTDKQ